MRTDQPNQVKDYLDFLAAVLQRFLLIYLSPTGEGPKNRVFRETSWSNGTDVSRS